MLVSSQCCSAYALLKSRLTSTFLVGSAAQAQRLVYEDVRRNWELVSSRCGVVLGDDSTTVLGVCQLQLRSDKYGTMAWVRSCLPLLTCLIVARVFAPRRVPVPEGVYTEILGCCGCRAAKLGALEGHEYVTCSVCGISQWDNVGM